MTNPNTPPNTTQIRIGGKTYSGLEDMPPEIRQKFEHMIKQMRASGALEDKNRDGIPDRFETSLRVAGWIGKLTGNPQLKERLQQQLKALGAAAGTPASPRASSSQPRSQAPPTPAEPARIRTTTSSGKALPRPPMPAQQGSGITPRNTPRNTPPSVVQRSGHDPRDDTGLGEFLRKLAIVSAIVIAGYVALRLLGMA